MNLLHPATLAFQFLEKNFGFARSVESATLITYTTEHVQLDIWFDSHRSFELGVGIRRRDEISAGSADPSFDLGEILRTAHAPEAERFRCVQITNQSVLDSFVSEIAGLLSQYGSELLRGNPTAFRALQRNRETECEKHGSDVALSRARTTASEAWQRRDYAAVIEALCSVRVDLLTASERKRLQLARQRIGSAR